MQPAEAARGETDPEEGAYPQPPPKLLYVHDDLTDEVERRFGGASPAAALVRSLFALLAGDGTRVEILTVAQQVERVSAQGPHAPFDLALGIARAGVRVAEALHAKTGWFPRVHRRVRPPRETGPGGERAGTS